MLRTLNHIPKGFLTAKPTELLHLLGGPALIHLSGERKPHLFVSILLHGNETSGLDIMQEVLSRYQAKPLPRSLLLFVGNVYAAKENLRKLDKTSDYNRIWKEGDCAEWAIAREVILAAKAAGVEVAIDLHNNTGKNPVYGCIRDADQKHKNLAKMFSNLAMHSPLPKETLCHTFSDFCVSITCECGLPGSKEGIEKGVAFVERCLLNGLEKNPSGNLTLYSASARIHIPNGIPVHFANRVTNEGFTFPTEMDLWNFCPLEKGHVFGYRSNHSIELLELGEDKMPITESLFWYRGNEIIVEKPFTPSMLTQNIPAIHQDCLGYAMQPLN